jgi:hypothetical protein
VLSFGWFLTGERAFWSSKSADSEYIAKEFSVEIFVVEKEYPGSVFAGIASTEKN